jgi:hypothetical protein
VCNDTVTHPEEASGSGGRPWPAPSPDADWWRADTTDAPPADPPADPPAAPRPDDPAGPDFDHDGFDDPDLVGIDLDEPDLVASELDEPDQPEPDQPEPDQPEPDQPEPDESEPDESGLGARGSAARPYDQPPRPPSRSAPTAPVPARREPERVAWVTEPVPVTAPPVPVESPPTPVEPAPVPRQSPPVRAVPAVPVQRRTVPPLVRRPPRRRRRRLPRRPWFALPALVVLALATTFFAWVSAEPFWLAVGHGHSGTATVVAGGGQPDPADGCRAFFIAGDGSFIASDVDLRGLGPAECTDGTEVTAHMVSVRADQAYATTEFGLHLRWLSGLGLVLLCALIIVWLTGAARFNGWRRGVAVGLSLGGPAAVTIAMLTTTF